MKEGESSAGGLPSDRPSSLIIIVDIHEKLWEERAAAGYPSITEVMEAIMAFVRAYFMRESSIHHAPPKTSAQKFSPRKVNSATIPDICIASLHPSIHPFFFCLHIRLTQHRLPPLQYTRGIASRSYAPTQAVRTLSILCRAKLNRPEEGERAQRERRKGEWQHRGRGWRWTNSMRGCTRLS